LALFAEFVPSAGVEAPDEQKARVQRVEDPVVAPHCYTKLVSRHQSEGYVQRVGRKVPGDPHIRLVDSLDSVVRAAAGGQCRSSDS